MINAEVLERIADDAFQTELGAVQRRDQHPAARCSTGEVFDRARAADPRRASTRAEDKARAVGRAHDARRHPADARPSSTCTRGRCRANPRYALLNEQIFAARGEDLQLSIDGVERLSAVRRLDRPGGGVHERAAAPAVHPDAFAAHWNAAQAIAGVQLAVGANSPFFFGKRAVARDPHRAVRAGHGHAAGGAQGAGRAPAGVVRRALDHLDLRPLRGERPLLPGAAAAVRGRGPGGGARGAATRRGCSELQLHNGTVYRWNRPVYEVVRGRPHVRVENRVLPAGPTVVDILANAAFYYGLVRIAGGERAPDLVADVLLRRGGQPARGRARRPRRPRLLARRRRRPGDRARAAAAAAARPRGARALRRRPDRARPAARHHRAPLRRGGERRDLAGRARSGASTRSAGSIATRRCGG